jgi:hypothetical protein
MTMVLRFVTKEGTKVYGPPYTKEEEADFYSRNANGPVTIARGAGDRKRADVPPQHPSPTNQRAPRIREQPSQSGQGPFRIFAALIDH